MRTINQSYRIVHTVQVDEKNFFITLRLREMGMNFAATSDQKPGGGYYVV
jgi:hypothetical protein